MTQHLHLQSYAEPRVVLLPPCVPQDLTTFFTITNVTVTLSVSLSLYISIARSSQSTHLHPFSYHGPHWDAHPFCAPPLHAGGPGFRYASLYFCCCVEPDDNELLTLEVIHRYVELLDKYFGSVSPSISKSTIITLLISWRSNSLLYLDSYSNIQMVIWEKLFTEILHNMKMFDPKEL